MLIFELDVYLTTEMFHQDATGAAGDLDGVPLDLFGLGVFPKLQNTTILTRIRFPILYPSDRLRV